MNVIEKWTKSGLLEGVVDKPTVASMLEITANYIMELRPEGVFTEMDSWTLPAMILLYNKVFKKNMCQSSFTVKEEILEVVKQVRTELEKGISTVAEIHGGPDFDPEAELVAYVTDKIAVKMIAQYN